MLQKQINKKMFLIIKPMKFFHMVIDINTNQNFKIRLKILKEKMKMK